MTGGRVLWEHTDKYGDWTSLERPTWDREGIAFLRYPEEREGHDGVFLDVDAVDRLQNALELVANRDAWRRAFALAKSAQDAGLIVVTMAPLNGRGEGYSVSLWSPDGAMWAESRESRAGVERLIADYRERRDRP